MKQFNRGILILSIMYVANAFAAPRCENACRLALTKCVANGNGFSVCQSKAAKCKILCD